jgi:hypothetical protein
MVTTYREKPYKGLDDELGSIMMLEVRGKVLGNSSPGRFNPVNKRELVTIHAT